MIDEKKQYLTRLTSRCEQYSERVKGNELNAEYASFDLLTSVFSALDGGISQQEINKALPHEAWRKHQVSFPVAWVRPLVNAWRTYADGGESISMERAFGISKGGRGSSNLRTTAKKRDEAQKLSNEVLIGLLRQGEAANQSGMISEVAARFGVSREKVREAYKEHSHRTLEKLSAGNGCQPIETNDRK